MLNYNLHTIILLQEDSPLLFYCIINYCSHANCQTLELTHVSCCCSHLNLEIIHCPLDNEGPFPKIS